MYPCAIPYSRIFHVCEQARCPGSDSLKFEPQQVRLNKIIATDSYFHVWGIAEPTREGVLKYKWIATSSINLSFWVELIDAYNLIVKKRKPDKKKLGNLFELL